MVQCLLIVLVTDFLFTDHLSPTLLAVLSHSAEQWRPGLS